MERVDWANTAPRIRTELNTKKVSHQYRWIRFRNEKMVVPVLLRFVGGEVFSVATLTDGVILTSLQFVEEWGPRFTYENSKEGTSLAAAQDLVLQKREKGVDCPCCGQYVKVYKRKLNVNMVNFLASLVKTYQYTQDWVSYRKCKFRGRDYSYLTCWGLAFTGRDVSGKRRTTGLWKPTQKGIDFVQGTIKVPTHVFLLDNEVQGFSSSLTFLSDVDGFNFHELMKA